MAKNTITFSEGVAKFLKMPGLAGKEVAIDLYPQAAKTKDKEGNVKDRANIGVTVKSGAAGIIVQTSSGPMRLYFWAKNAANEGAVGPTGDAL